MLAAVFVVSALIHVSLAPLMLMLAPDDTTLEPSALRSAQDFAINLVDEDQEQPEEPKPEDKARRFVQLPEPEQEKTPKQADFAARHADAVERQSVRPTEPGAAKPAPQFERPSEHRAAELAAPEPTPPPTPSPTPPQTEPEQPEDSEAEPTQSAPVEAVQAPDEPSDPLAELRQPQDAPAPFRPDQLFPKLSDPFMASREGDGGFYDHTREIDEGDRTLLNRHRTRYWAFFDRLVEQVRQHWAGGEVYRRHDPRGNVYGVRDRVTTLRISLLGDGQIHRIWISSPSGLDFLDEEAVRAVRAAAPFLNAPDGMKDRDGMVHFSFSFYIEIRADDSNWLRIKWR